MHLDLELARSGGEPFRGCETAFAMETPPACEVLAASRTPQDGGVAGVATVGAAGVEVAQRALARRKVGS